jgi:hypothetical protein
VTLVQAATVVHASEGELEKRLNNGLGLTPPMGWSSWVSLASLALRQDMTNNFVA